MQFAADPREFTRSGLPKYGVDLSDDERELEPYEYVLEDENKSGGSGSVQFAEGTKESSGHRLYDPLISVGASTHDDSAVGTGHSTTNTNTDTDSTIMSVSTGTGLSVDAGVRAAGSNRPTPTPSSSGSGSGSGRGGGRGSASTSSGGRGSDMMSMIRNEVRETKAARARGDLTGDLDFYKKNTSSGSNSNSNSNSGSGGYRGGHDLFRPLRTAVAYDSDLDMESSDEGST